MTGRLAARFVDEIPTALDEGVLYISAIYATASHQCVCGCGTRVVTPLSPERWALTFDGEATLRPSIGNGQFACRSHYLVTRGRIVWLEPMSVAAAERAMDADRAQIQYSYALQRNPLHRLRDLMRRVWAAVRRGRDE